MNKNSTPYLILAWSLVGLGMIVTIWLMVQLKSEGWRFWNINSINLEKSGQFGDYVGGFVGTLFSLSGFIFLYLTLREQRSAFKKERFENHFFELIKLHKENINELSCTRFNGHTNDHAKNRKVFKVIFNEFEECLIEVRRFLKSSNPDDYYTSAYKKKITDIYTSKGLKVDLIQLVSIDIAYCVVFFGLGKEGYMVLKKYFLQKYKPEYYLHVLHYLRLKPSRTFSEAFQYWEILNSNSNKELTKSLRNIYYNDKPGNDVELNLVEEIVSRNLLLIKYYGGHQHRLGHYFRHLFQSYKFLNNQRGLGEEERYFYGKSLRAQLSTYEQALIFINSISSLGMKWELTSDSELTKGELTSMEPLNLISTYHIIKNLPGTHIYKIYFKDYYPNVKYEFQE